MFILPSRGRPHRLAELMAAYRQTDATAPVLVRVDDDDPSLEQYQALLRTAPSDWTLHVGPRVKVSGVYVEVFRDMPALDWYGFLGDDLVPITPEWDRLLIEAAGNDGVSWPNDGVQAPKCTHPVIGGDLVRCVGWLTPPGFLHWYCDTAWEAIAQVTKRAAYLENVLVTHKNPMLDPKVDPLLADATYAERFCDPARDWRDVGPGPDNRAWHQWLHFDFEETCARVIEQLPREAREAA